MGTGNIPRFYMAIKPLFSMILVLGSFVYAEEGDVKIHLPSAPISNLSFNGYITAEVENRPLGSYQLILTYDPGIVEIDSMLGANAGYFTNHPFYNADSFTTGYTIFAAYQRDSLTAPIGEIEITNIAFHVKTMADTLSEVGLIVEILSDPDGRRFLTRSISDTIQIVFSAFYKSVYAGWNLVGLPSNVEDSYYLTLFPNATQGTLFGWTGSYIQMDSLELGKGYWLRFPAEESIYISGSPVSSLAINLSQGWNLISGISCNVALTDVDDPQGIIIPGTLYDFNGAYIPADSIKRGKGYWLRASDSGQVSLTCATGFFRKLAKQSQPSLNLEQLPFLQIEDSTGASQSLYFGVVLETPDMKLSYSLPPVPPSGIFDARFSDESRINDSDEALIKIQSSSYPIKINVFNASPGKISAYTLTEILADKDIKTHQLREGETILITDPGIKNLRLKKSISIPLTFMISQNYPNPFNPTTEIKYGIPHTEKVEIIIYNALGQKIKTLVSEKKEPGFYTVVWDATNDAGKKVSSGIYFYRIQAGKYRAMKKMALVK